MDEAKEIKQKDDSLLSNTRRDLQLGITPDPAFSRRFLAFAKTGHTPSEKPKTIKDPNLNTSPWRFLQNLNSLFVKRPEPIRIPEETQE